MSNNPYSSNPFGSPYASGPSTPAPSGPRGTMGKVMAPGIAMCILSGLGFLASIFGVINAAISEPQPVPPDAPEFVRNMSEGAVGPVAMVMQGIFIIVNIVIFTGGFMMTKTKMWGLGLTAAILSMVNFGNCCCIAGAPVGIWAIVILLMSDVQAAFKANS